MSRSKKPRKPTFRNHTAKTKDEQDAYRQKVKLSESEGGTRDNVYPRTSTLSERSLFSGQSSTGIPDREQIVPPGIDVKNKFYEKMGFWIQLLSAITILGGVIVYVTTIKNKCDSNENEITKVEATVKEIDQKREELQTRITKLEQWDHSFSEDIKELKIELNSKVSVDHLERRISELEKVMEKKYENVK